MPGGVVGVIEVAQHRRMAQRRGKEVAEAAERMGPDRAVFVVADEDAEIGFVLVHVEMVEPEPCQALAQLVGRIQRVQDGPGCSLLRTIIHGLLVDLLRRLLLLGIGHLVGGLALLIERHCDVEGKAVRVRHRRDLRARRFRQDRCRGGMQLLLKPALDADLLQTRGAGCADAPRQTIEHRYIARRQFGRIGRQCDDRSQEHPQGR
jgi:hypothetical protein